MKMKWTIHESAIDYDLEWNYAEGRKVTEEEMDEWLREREARAWDQLAEEDDE